MFATGRRVPAATHEAAAQNYASSQYISKLGPDILLDEFYNRFVTCELRDRRKTSGVNENVYINIRKFVAVLKEFGGKSLEN